MLALTSTSNFIRSIAVKAAILLRYKSIPNNHPITIMRSTPIVLASSLFLAANAQLIPFLFKGEPNAPNLDIQAEPKRQRIMDPNTNAPVSGPGIQLPPPSSDDKSPSNNNGGDSNDAVILSDVIGSESSINIFAGFTRSVSSVSNRLETSLLNTTVLAPLNRAITALPRKPWEDPREYAALGPNAYDGKDGEDRAQRNMRRFTEAHIVPVSPWEEGVKVESLGGGNVWWEKKDGKAVVMPGGVVVEKIAQKVGNGEVWVLEGVLNYAS